MPKLNKTQTSIVIDKSSNLIKANTVRGQVKVITTTPPNAGRVVVTKKNSGTVELRYVPLEPNPQPPSSTF